MALTFDEICIDANDAAELGAWWSEVLGWRQHVDKDGDVVLRLRRRRTQLAVYRCARRQGRQKPHSSRLPARRSAGGGGSRDRVGRAARRHRPGRADLGGAGRPGGQRILHSCPERLMPVLPRLSVFARRHAAFHVHFADARRVLRMMWVVLLVGGCATALPIDPVSTTEPTSPPVPLTIGPAATDTYGGWIPDGHTLSPFDVSNRRWLNSIRPYSPPFRRSRERRPIAPSRLGPYRRRQNVPAAAVR